MKQLESLFEDDKLEEIGPPYVCWHVYSWVFIFSTPSLTHWALWGRPGWQCGHGLQTSSFLVFSLLGCFITCSSFSSLWFLQSPKKRGEGTMRSNAPAMFQPCVGSQPKKRDINPVGLSQAEEFILNPAFQLLLPLKLFLILFLLLILSILLILFLLLIL